MSRFRKLSHAIWHCQYHLVWTPKYRFRILTGEVAQEVNSCIRAFSEQLRCEVIELNVQIDHVHVLLMIPPKVAVSDYVGTVKGRTAIRVFNRFRHLRRKPYWGIIFGRRATVLIRLVGMPRRSGLTSSTRRNGNVWQSKVG